MANGSQTSSPRWMSTGSLPFGETRSIWDCACGFCSSIQCSWKLAPDFLSASHAVRDEADVLRLPPIKIKESAMSRPERLPRTELNPKATNLGAPLANLDCAPYIGAVKPPTDPWGTLPHDPRRKSSPASARNREPILEVLRRFFPAEGRVVEVASGSGEHAVYFATSMPGWVWQPSDRTADNASSIVSWTEATRCPNVLPPVLLDLGETTNQRGTFSAGFDAGFCANLIHIAPWSVCTGLMAFMGDALAKGAPLVTYGPYKINGRHTAPSNEQFEAWLHSQNPAYGVRDMAEVVANAAAFGLNHVDTVPMPANNFCLVFRKTS